MIHLKKFQSVSFNNLTLTVDPDESDISMSYIGAVLYDSKDFILFKFL